MDELESIDKLRGIICDVNVDELSANIQQPVGTGREARVSPAWVDSWRKAAARALDEIEREVADRYIALPVDADGVPIHELDTLYDRDSKEFLVTRLAVDGGWTVYSWGKPGIPKNYRHAKPRTIEDVLHDFWEEWESHPIDTEWGVRLKRLRESEAKYAEEIRELMEVAE